MSQPSRARGHTAQAVARDLGSPWAGGPSSGLLATLVTRLLDLMSQPSRARGHTAQAVARDLSSAACCAVPGGIYLDSGGCSPAARHTTLGGIVLGGVSIAPPHAAPPPAASLTMAAIPYLLPPHHPQRHQSRRQRLFWLAVISFLIQSRA